MMRDLRGFPGPRVLMGDLNMTPPTPSRWTRMRSLGEASTFPADEPCQQLDHILTDDPALRVEDARRHGCRFRIIARLSSTFRGSEAQIPHWRTLPI